MWSSEPRGSLKALQGICKVKIIHSNCKTVQQDCNVMEQESSVTYKMFITKKVLSIFDRHTATLVYVFCCFCDTLAELSSCDRN